MGARSTASTVIPNVFSTSSLARASSLDDPVADEGGEGGKVDPAIASNFCRLCVSEVGRLCL